MKWARSSLNQMLLICSPCKSCLPHRVRLVLTSSKTWWRLCANCITIGIIPFTCVRFCLFGLYFAVFLICRCNFSKTDTFGKSNFPFSYNLRYFSRQHKPKADRGESEMISQRPHLYGKPRKTLSRPPWWIEDLLCSWPVLPILNVVLSPQPRQLYNNLNTWAGDKKGFILSYSVSMLIM